MDRNQYDFSHHIFMTGKIGRLQTLSRFMTFPGDSVEMYFANLFRLSPLRRTLSLDAIIDVATFWVPMRHVFSNWKDFVLEGIDESQTLSSWTHDSIPWGYYNAATAGMSYLGMNMIPGDTYSDALLYPYNQIWNRFFRSPTVTPVVDDDYQGADSAAPTGHTSANSPILGANVDVVQYGLPVPRKKRPWTTGVTTTLAAADYQIDMTATHILDIRTIAQMRGRLTSEQQRDWFSIRYKDILEHWGVDNVNIDADERPELCNRQTFNLSGRDVDGTGDGNLGDSTGKALDFMDYYMPRKFFHEHGMLWTVACIRFPTIAYSECQPWELRSNPTYKEMGDGELAQHEPPAADTIDSWNVDGGATSIGTIPYGQEHRTHRNHIHTDFQKIRGFPFLEASTINTFPKSIYCNSTDYDEMFSSLQLGHWQLQSSAEVEIQRSYPGPLTSIFAGTK